MLAQWLALLPHSARDPGLIPASGSDRVISKQQFSDKQQPHEKELFLPSTNHSSANAFGDLFPTRFDLEDNSDPVPSECETTKGKLGFYLSLPVYFTLLVFLLASQITVGVLIYTQRKS
eukprot:g34783.t1